MTSRFYIFNPDTDLALGNNSSNYQPPRLVRKLADDLSVLPAWYAQGKRRVVYVDDLKKVYQWVDNFPLPLDVLWTSSMKCADNCDEIVPWGWNPSLLKKLKLSGVMPYKLPTDYAMDVFRKLSSRQTSVYLLQKLNRFPDLCGYSYVCYTIDDINKRMLQWVEDGDMLYRKLLKAPWSGSGKGLKWANNESEAIVKNWCRHILDTQHAVIVEPEYNKVEDFAMEFYADGNGNISFEGYSLFTTAQDGSYKCNYLMSDEKIVERLSHYVSREMIDSLRSEVQSQLASLLRCDYKGFLGIDMMICRFSHKPLFRLHPCVEINLRMNMGILSHSLYKNWIDQDSCGIFKIDYFNTSDDLLCRHNDDIASFPLLIERGRIKKGYLALNPISSDTRFRSYIKVDIL